MSRTRNLELAKRDKEIYRLYSKEKWSLQDLANKYFMTVSSIRTICKMQSLYEEDIKNEKHKQ